MVVFDWRTLVRLQCRREESSNSRVASANRQEMAIPFALPSDDEAETQTQQLEQLMLDLYAALQQVLRSRTAQHPSSRNREFNEFLRHILTYLEIFVRILTHLTSDPLRWTMFCSWQQPLSLLEQNGTAIIGLHGHATRCHVLRAFFLLFSCGIDLIAYVVSIGYR